MSALWDYEAHAARIEETRRSLRQLGFSTKSQSALINHGITTREQLLSVSRSEIMKIDGFGRGALRELENGVPEWSKLHPDQSKLDEIRRLLRRIVSLLEEDRGS